MPLLSLLLNITSGNAQDVTNDPEVYSPSIKAVSTNASFRDTYNGGIVGGIGGIIGGIGGMVGGIQCLQAAFWRHCGGTQCLQRHCWRHGGMAALSGGIGGILAALLAA